MSKTMTEEQDRIALIAKWRSHTFENMTSMKPEYPCLRNGCPDNCVRITDVPGMNQYLCPTCGATHRVG